MLYLQLGKAKKLGGGGHGRSKILVGAGGSVDDRRGDDPRVGHAGAFRGVVVLRGPVLADSATAGFLRRGVVAVGWKDGLYPRHGGQPRGRRFLSRDAHDRRAVRAARWGGRGGGGLGSRREHVCGSTHCPADSTVPAGGPRRR